TNSSRHLPRGNWCRFATAVARVAQSSVRPPVRAENRAVVPQWPQKKVPAQSAIRPGAASVHKKVARRRPAKAPAQGQVERSVRRAVYSQKPILAHPMRRDKLATTGPTKG